VLDLLAIRLIGIVPEDDNVIVGTNRGTPAALEPKSIAGQAFRNIAQRMLGYEVPFIELESKANFWSRIQRITGRK
jgi:septum site-determining protein MinD